MHQRRVIALTEKFQQVDDGVNVGGDCIAQVRIKVRQPGAVGYQIEGAGQVRLSNRVEPQPGQADVAFHHFHFLFQKVRQLCAVNFLQTIKGRRLFNDFLKASLGGSRPVWPDEKRDFPNLRNLFKQVHEPDFADEAGYADQHQVLPH
jgi:hypothetical protein